MPVDMSPPPRGPVPSPTASQGRIARAIWIRAVADKAGITGVLAFYLLAIGAGMGALWPPLRETFVSLAHSLPSGFDALLGGVPLSTPAGWLNAELLSMLAPGFLIATALISGASATAGEEQSRTMALVLSTGTARTTFLLAKSAAVLTHVVVVALAMFVGLLAGNAIGDMGLSTSTLLDVTVWATLIALPYAALTLTVGALSGRRRPSLAIPGGVVGVSFVLSMFLPLNPSLTGLAKINLWYPYSGNVAIVNGIDWAVGAFILILTAVIALVGIASFPRRQNLHG